MRESLPWALRLRGVLISRRRLVQEFPPSGISVIVFTQKLDELVIGRFRRRRLGCGGRTPRR
jgi:hypothetical protein